MIKWELYLSEFTDWTDLEAVERAKEEYCRHRHDLPEPTYEELNPFATGCRPPDDDTTADGWHEYGGLSRSDNH